MIGFTVLALRAEGVGFFRVSLLLSLAKILHDIHSTCRQGNHMRCSVVGADLEDIGAIVYQEPHQAEITFASSIIQRSPSVLVGRVDISAAAQSRNPARSRWSGKRSSSFVERETAMPPKKSAQKIQRPRGGFVPLDSR